MTSPVTDVSGLCGLKDIPRGYSSQVSRGWKFFWEAWTSNSKRQTRPRRVFLNHPESLKTNRL